MIQLIQWQQWNGLKNHYCNTRTLKLKNPIYFIDQDIQVIDKIKPIQRPQTKNIRGKACTMHSNQNFALQNSFTMLSPGKLNATYQVLKKKQEQE